MIEAPMVDNHCTLRKTNYAVQNHNCTDGIDIADSKTKQNDISYSGYRTNKGWGDPCNYLVSHTIHAGLSSLLSHACTYTNTFALHDVLSHHIHSSGTHSK